MRRSMVLMVVLLLATMVVAVVPASAGESCHNINARGEGQASEEPPDEDFDARTVARIRGGGLLQGTTEAQFYFIEPLNPPVFTFAGYIEFTTNRGTLRVSFTDDSPGTFNVATGDFAATGLVTAATGKLDGAHGSLTFEGVQDLLDPAQSFTETVTGEICVDLGDNGKR